MTIKGPLLEYHLDPFTNFKTRIVVAHSDQPTGVLFPSAPVTIEQAALLSNVPQQEEKKRPTPLPDNPTPATLAALRPPEAARTGIAHHSRIVDEMTRFYTLGASGSFDQIYEAFVQPILAWFQQPGAWMWLSVMDKPGAPGLTKHSTLDERKTRRAKTSYPSTALLTRQGLRVPTAASPPVVQAPHDEGMSDAGHTAVATEVVSIQMHRLMDTAHLRVQLYLLLAERMQEDERMARCRVLFDYQTTEKPFLLHEGKRTLLDDGVNLQEADLACIIWASRLLRAAPDTHLCIQSIDGDLVLLAELHAQGLLAGTGSLVVHRRGRPELSQVYDIRKTVDTLVSRSRTAEALVLAFLLCGTDFVTKGDLFPFVGDTVILDAVRAYIDAKPGERLSALLAGDEHHITALVERVYSSPACRKAAHKQRRPLSKVVEAFREQVLVNLLYWIRLVPPCARAG